VSCSELNLSLHIKVRKALQHTVLAAGTMKSWWSCTAASGKRHVVQMATACRMAAWPGQAADIPTKKCLCHLAGYIRVAWGFSGRYLQKPHANPDNAIVQSLAHHWPSRHLT
jgi:hypothetical protein